MCSTPRVGACGALFVCLAVLAAGCGDDRAATFAGHHRGGPAGTLRTLYVQAPLTGPAADEGRAMVDAVRLVVGQAHGLAGDARVIVRTLDDGGVGTATVRSAAPTTPAARSPIRMPWP